MLRAPCLLLSSLLCLTCASSPAAPAPGRSNVWGEVRLVPREGIPPRASDSPAYRDRRMRDVEFVDYSTPGFAVVYVEGAPQAGEQCRIAIEDRTSGARLKPGHCALGAGGTLAVANASPAPHLVSVPGRDVIRRLAPGEVVEIPIPGRGEQSVYLLDEPSAEARVFAVPGPYSIASPAGRYALSDLAAGRRELRVWHPRFPPASRWAELRPDRVERVDFELSVGELPEPGGTVHDAP